MSPFFNIFIPKGFHLKGQGQVVVLFIALKYAKRVQCKWRATTLELRRDKTFLARCIEIGSPIMGPPTPVGVLLLKAKIAAWEPMKKTTFAGARPVDSNCIAVSQAVKTSPS
ncbi:hypothetical protein TNCV_4360061 [Trichonephila clavipes]|uniref:Uncharacterized protein n=1 Tax=Trichonephila clavipes TaxID=2585209 RepID=A0A8X7BHY9_TRICX|nr:hypothetical protein TNCV_4360061 [Trichonephila clavipes]